MDTPVH